MKSTIKQLNQQAYALFLVRLVVGIVFILHGGQKVFGWFGGQGMEVFVKWMATLGVNQFWAYMAAFAEFIGGIMIFFGFATEIGVLLFIPVMVGAIFLVHWPHGYFIQNNGLEYTFNLILFGISLIIGGPGKFFLWDPFANLRDKV